MASVPTDVIGPLKRLCKMQMAADAVLPTLVSQPDVSTGFDGFYIDTVPAPGPRGLPSRARLYPAVVVRDMWADLKWAAGPERVVCVGFEVLLNVSAATDSATDEELIPIADAIYAALLALTGAPVGALQLRSMIPETPLSDTPQAATGVSHRWLGALWRAKGDM